MENIAIYKISKKSITFLRISIGIIYFWFGALKFFHGYSPAEDLAINTINKLTFGLVPMPYNINILAFWECLVGLLLMFGFYIKIALILLFVHMICTFLPFFFFPDLSFNIMPYGFSLVGQYIMKNIIIICASYIIWQTLEEKS
jgi:uncharacterized membrane protein YphA (DoxX/SURF4 family)